MVIARINISSTAKLRKHSVERLALAESYYRDIYTGLNTIWSVLQQASGIGFALRLKIYVCRSAWLSEFWSPHLNCGLFAAITILAVSGFTKRHLK